ncbi:MAG: hypothetical protein JGK04_18280 [Microcoleus sp. PH2017_39_LGB_O_B]|uniref:hypothetical protein n=1 Tax=unclassified Microcoleus TaxID=2642155 RepID=UPI001E1493B8|nr:MULTISPECIES: hypothetical protein [unclassified Microcoleus]MCC3468920.1 hypothetical protein [Microcoleus sp. PH2017_06_SFM_O_A]TAF87065.1 MAG: hypothetical protein EAZ49_21560 [Oscillatoriales cyanobacterium]MCC3449450.1 hypothetical protein [Microcoleus sp. PH2017_09_SFU_O_A]MCC3630335.1 hypothetical protein [Microcoleus sp. PH2017_39_LGB_O_B]MCC3642445.1 hypothetical protein [Microcoleus sp. PH2017_33_LGB_O_A]
MLIETKKLKDIATWMKAEHPPEFPEALQGIFFMDGNILPDYCLTMYNSEWNPGQRTLLLRIYEPVVWTFHSSMAGRMLLYAVKFSRFSYLFRFSDATLQHGHITPIAFGLSVPPWIMDFLIDRDPNTPNGDIWDRRNSFFGRAPEKGYTLRRVVNKDSSPTAAFPDFLSKVGSDCLIIAQE